MDRFAVFGYGYNPRLPTCFVFAATLEEAWEIAKNETSRHYNCDQSRKSDSCRFIISRTDEP